MSFVNRKPVFWDSSDVIVEILSRAFEKAGWRVATASSRAEKRYPTGDGQTIFPDMVAIDERYCLFSEVKSRMFLLRGLTREHISYHFAPEPRCQNAFRSLRTKDQRDTGSCEMQRLVKASAAHAALLDKQGLASAIIPQYVTGWKLEELTGCIEELNSSSRIPVELWILNRRASDMSLEKRVDRHTDLKLPAIAGEIVKDVFSYFVVRE